MLKNVSLSALVVLTSEALLQIYCSNYKQKHATLKLFSSATCWNQLYVLLNPFHLQRDAPKQMAVQKPAFGLGCSWGHSLPVQALLKVKALSCCSSALDALDPLWVGFLPSNCWKWTGPSDLWAPDFFWALERHLCMFILVLCDLTFLVCLWCLSAFTASTERSFRVYPE